MKLVIKGPVGAERVDDLKSGLTTDWSLAVWTPEEGESALAEKMATAHALIAMTWPASAPEAPFLKLLQLPGAGYDGIAFERLPADAWVCNIFEHEIPIAEYCLLAMLEWNIGLRRMDTDLRAGRWTGSFFGAGGVQLHGELAGKTVGIVGYGHIGREVAKRTKAFGTTVNVCTRTPQAEDTHADRIAGMDSLADLLAEADFLVIACPLTEATRGLIGPTEFAVMKETAVIINVARGAVIDEDALYEACANRDIAGAVIDVWYNYPKTAGEETMPSRHPFHELDNVFLSPHSSGLGEGLLKRRWQRMADNLNAVAEGRRPENVLREPGGEPPE